MAETKQVANPTTNPATDVTLRGTRSTVDPSEIRRQACQSRMDVEAQICDRAANPYSSQNRLEEIKAAQKALGYNDGQMHALLKGAYGKDAIDGVKQMSRKEIEEEIKFQNELEKQYGKFGHMSANDKYEEALRARLKDLDRAEKAQEAQAAAQKREEEARRAQEEKQQAQQAAEERHDAFQGQVNEILADNTIPAPERFAKLEELRKEHGYSHSQMRHMTTEAVNALPDGYVDGLDPAQVKNQRDFYNLLEKKYGVHQTEGFEDALKARQATIALAQKAEADRQAQIERENQAAARAEELKAAQGEMDSVFSDTSTSVEQRIEEVQRIQQSYGLSKEELRNLFEQSGALVAGQVADYDQDALAAQIKFEDKLEAAFSRSGHIGRLEGLEQTLKARQRVDNAAAKYEQQVQRTTGRRAA